MSDRARRFRAMCVAAMGVSLLPIWMLTRHRSTSPVVGGYSLAVWASVAGLLAFWVVALSLLLRPDRWFRVYDRWLSGKWISHDETVHARDRRRWRGIVALAVGVGLAYGYLHLLHNTAPTGDQIDYLAKAAEVRAVGASNLWREHWQGTWREDNRHPLYLVLIHQAPTFDRAKILTLMLSALMMGLLLWRISTLFGARVTALVSVLWAANDTWASESSQVSPETLLTFWLGLAWLEVVSLVRSERNGDRRPPEDRRIRLAPYLRAGLWLGLAYLTKGSALPFLACFGAWALRRRRVAGAVAAIGVFVLVASPLLARNVRVFGNPLHEYSGALMWADSAPEGIRRIQAGEPIGWRRYLAEHTWKDMVDRAVSGVVWEVFVIARVHGLGPVGDRRIMTGLPLVALAAIALAAGGLAERPFVGALTLLSIALFGWYQPIASGDRFVLFLLPIGLTYAAVSLRHLAARHGWWPLEAPGTRRSGY